MRRSVKLTGFALVTFWLWARVIPSDSCTLQAGATGSDNMGRTVFGRNRQATAIYYRIDSIVGLIKFPA
jgi:hypothetical protein